MRARVPRDPVRRFLEQGHPSFHRVFKFLISRTNFWILVSAPPFAVRAI